MRDPQPRPPGAGVTGNVGTSMCVTNAIFGALGLMADSRCTMGNFTFGNARHQYDETIPGATMRSILPSKNELMRGSSCRSRGRRTVQPPMSTMRCSCPSRYSHSVVSSVRQTVRWGWGRSFVLPGLRAGQCVGVRSAGLAHVQGACTGGFKSRLPGM